MLSLAEKVESGNDYAQSQPRVNQERLKKCSIGNLNRFNQNRFRLKRLIPIEHDLNQTNKTTVETPFATTLVSVQL